MIAHAVLSVVGIATLGTDIPGNKVMHRTNMFRERSFFFPLDIGQTVYR